VGGGAKSKKIKKKKKTEKKRVIQGISKRLATNLGALTRSGRYFVIFCCTERTVLHHILRVFYFEERLKY
jgi:hypothetical protein